MKFKIKTEVLFGLRNQKSHSTKTPALVGYNGDQKANKNKYFYLELILYPLFFASFYTF